MARTFTFVPTTANNGTPATVPMSAIPADVKVDLEEAYEALKSNPSGRLNAVFADKREAHQFETWAKSYCAQRTVIIDGEEVEAPVRFRKSPTKGLPENQIDFRITDIPVEAEAETETPATAPVVETPKPRKAARKAA